MKRVIGLAVLGLALALPALSRADDILSGTWKLTTVLPASNAETTNWLLKLETKDGKTTGTLLSANPQYKGPELVSFATRGDTVKAVVKYGAVELTFEGKVSKDGKKITGTMGNAQVTNLAYMEPSDLAKIEAKEVVRKLNPEDFQAWADAANKTPKDYSPVWIAELNIQVAIGFASKNKAVDAVTYAQAAEKALDGSSSVDLQVRVLQTLASALDLAGKAEERKPIVARLEKLEKVLDAEYHAKVPPFKGKDYAGRQAKSDRVVLFELFTGAQCPPCVASDVAFDVLQKSYKTSELVLLQYHLHIPGPDPMTNPDTQARWQHYRDAHGSKNIGGVPTAIFNGKTYRVGGGAMANSEKTYGVYCGMIDPMLETEAGCKLKATAKRHGDKIEITADVAGLKNPGNDVKLRLVLAEETIRYVGGNKIRFHHQVVRSMIPSPVGTAVKKEDFKTTATVELPALRKSLTTYLDEWVSIKGAFRPPDRPMDLRNLRVIAFVQDDSTHEILQAVQAEVVE
jgi:hypothetical protein